MAYVRFDKDLADDWRIYALAAELLKHWQAGMSETLRDEFRTAACNAVIGGLFKLWSYADTHIRQKNVLHVTLETLADITNLPVTVLRKFPTDWLKDNGSAGVQLPGYSEKNCLIDKDIRREKTRQRVEKWRQRKAKEKRNAGNSVTGGNGGVTTGTGPGTGPGTGTTVPGTGTETVPEAPLARAAERRLAARDQHTLDQARQRDSKATQHAKGRDDDMPF